MISYTGKTIFEGYAISNLVVFETEKMAPKRTFTSAEIEFERFKAARVKSLRYYESLYLNALKKIGEKEAQLFQTYRLMAEDLDLEDLVKENIGNRLVAEEAVLKAAEQLSKILENSGDEYLKNRAFDIIEVGNVLRNILLGVDTHYSLTSPAIIICEDLSVSVLTRFNKQLLKGVVFTKSNVTSHAAIVLRTLQIPSICSIEERIDISKLKGEHVILDSSKGILIVNPTDEVLDKYKNIKENYYNEIESLHNLIGTESRTKDNRKVKLFANIASAFEVNDVNKNDAEGIGLYRSEFIYLSSRNYPTEEFQFQYYREVLEDMNGKEVVIRTFDIGADKKPEYFDIMQEENPAMGYRSIRICHDRPEILYTQLRALLRASIYGNLKILIPMVISVDEILFVKDMIKKIKKDLDENNIPYSNSIKLGTMIETPAAALISDLLAKEVDFFSIGTNDLTQYTLAIDRLNPKLSHIFNPYHPGLLSLIKLTVDNAKKNNIECGICGELAHDPKAIPFLLACGMDELSMTSAYILKTRKLIRKIDTSKVDINSYLKF